MGKYQKLLLTDNVILNGGDSAILAGTINGIVNQSGCSQEQMSIHCDYYDAAITHYPELPLQRSLQEAIRKYPPSFFWRFDKPKRFSWLSSIALSPQEREAYQAYQQADAVVTCGGSFLTDAYDLTLTCFGYDLALQLNKPMILLGQSLGPFKSEEKKAFVAKRLQRFDKIVVRDHLSYQTALEMGCEPEQVIEGRDMAFLIETGAQPKQKPEGKLTIGLSLRRWTYPYAPSEQRDELYQNYLKSLAEVASRLVDQFDANVVFLSTCQGDKAYSFQDSDVAKEVLAMLALEVQSQCSVIDSFQTPESFLANLSTIDVFVGTRMHSCILSLISNIPTINICYEFKSKELFESMGLDEFVIDIEAINANEVSQMVAQALASYTEVSQQINDKVNEFRLLNQSIIAKVFG